MRIWDAYTKRMEPEIASTKNALSVPISIIVAGLLIAGAIFLSRGTTNLDTKRGAVPPNTKTATLQDMNIRPLTEKDHIKGNPNATILIFEYSDTECPFCKVFHKTMQDLIDAYGKSGEVAWIYRHFPLTQIHPKAVQEAEALECAGELGGNGKFWEYAEEIFRVTPSNNGLDLAELPKIAERIKLEKIAFQSCLDSERKLTLVQEDLNEAVQAGGNGTPFNILVLREVLSKDDQKKLLEINQEILSQLPANSPDPIVIASDKKKVSIGGAFQLPLMKEIIDLLLKE